MSYVPRHSVTVPARVKAARAAVTSVATAVVGTGVAVATAGAANASGSVWDRVAACESGGNWSINTGNGFYGGLQFTRSTWLGFGGGDYASSAQYASRAQQIAVAQRVLAVQGPGAWPVCSVQAGLTRSNGGASSSAGVSSSRSTTRDAVSKRSTTAVSGSAVQKIQKRVGVAADGVIGPMTSRAIQRFVGAQADGVIGPRTIAAMESKAGMKHSGASSLNAAIVNGFAAYCGK